MVQTPIPPQFYGQTWSGKVRTLPYEPLTPEETLLFDADFSVLANMMKNLDPEVGQKFSAAKEWYKIAAGIAKKSMDLAYGGVEPSSGQVGMVPLMPYPMLAARTWNVTVAAGWQDHWGTEASPISGNATEGTMRMYTIQDLLSFGPSSIQTLRFNINGHQYPCYPVQMFTELPKTNSYIRVLPLLAKILVHTKGKFYLRTHCKQAGVENLQPLGLMFAEFAYLNLEESFYT